MDNEGLTKPEGVAIEIADVMMLALDLAAGLRIDLLDAIETKLAYNRVRKYRRDAAGAALAYDASAVDSTHPKGV